MVFLFIWGLGFERSKMRQSGGLPLAAGLDGGDTLIKSNPSSSAKTKQLIRKDGLFCFMRVCGFERPYLTLFGNKNIMEKKVG